jgi:Phage integrase family
VKYGLHSLHHFFSSWAIEQGFSPKRLQALLGHSSIQMTFDTYGHLFPSLEEPRQIRRRRAADPRGGRCGMSNVEDELFLMTNLYPASTGLPMVIWVRPELWRSSTTCRIKVSMAHGTRTDPRNLAKVGVRPTPHLVAGQLSTADLQAVTEWIRLNEKAIIDHWNRLTDGVQLGQQLKRLPASPAARHQTHDHRREGVRHRRPPSPPL